MSLYYVNSEEIEDAVKVLEDGINVLGNNIYLLRDMFDIYESIGDISKMKATLDRIKLVVNEERSGFKSIEVHRQAVLNAHMGINKYKIQEFINKQSCISIKSKGYTLSKVESIINRKK